MTLEEAIGIKREFLENEGDGIDSYEYGAIQLGIEALERIKGARDRGEDMSISPLACLLPSETEK